MSEFLSKNGPEDVREGLAKVEDRIYYNRILKYLKIDGLTMFLGQPRIFVGPGSINDFDQLGITLIHEAIHVNDGFMKNIYIPESVHGSIELNSNNIWYDLVDKGINW